MVMRPSQSTRYPDSRNTQSITQGSAFERLVSNEIWSVWRQPLTLSDDINDQFKRGDAVEGYEIKLDNHCTKTRRLSIEIAERTALHRPWVASGIYASSNARWYVQGNTDRFWVFDRNALRVYHKEFAAAGGEVIRDNPATIAKFYLSVEEATAMCLYAWSGQPPKLNSPPYTSTECDLWLFMHGYRRIAKQRWVTRDGVPFP
jgi:hypothetical protein